MTQGSGAPDPGTGTIRDSTEQAGVDNAAVLDLGDVREDIILQFDVGTRGTLYLETSEDKNSWFEHDVLETAASGEDNVEEYVVASEYFRVWADDTEFSDADINLITMVSKR